MPYSGRKFLVLAIAIGWVVATVSPASADHLNGDGRVQFIRAQGSDSTIDVMWALDAAFNQSEGCHTTPSTGPSPLDSTCAEAGDIHTENHDHDIAISFYPTGSSHGISILSKFGEPFVSKMDFARSSRARNANDNPGLRFVAFAGDATPWVNFREGPGDESSVAAGVDDLTKAQLIDVYLDCDTDAVEAGQQMDWQDLGAAATAPILVWTAQQGSGERASFDAFVGGNSETCVTGGPTGDPIFGDTNLGNGERIIFENNPAPIYNCVASSSCPGLNHTHSIFHMGFGAWQSFPANGPNGPGGGADLGAINGVAVSAATIADGTYIANRLVFNVYRKAFPTNNVVQATYEFMSEEGWICKPNTQHSDNPRTGVNYGQEVSDIIAAQGFVPLSEATITDPGFPGGSIQSKCRIS